MKFWETRWQMTRLRPSQGGKMFNPREVIGETKWPKMVSTNSEHRALGDRTCTRCKYIECSCLQLKAEAEAKKPKIYAGERETMPGFIPGRVIKVTSNYGQGDFDLYDSPEEADAEQKRDPE